MQIDHLVYAAPDLAEIVDDLERRLGVRASGGGQHLGWGTHNTLLSLGARTYLELIAPDPAQPEPDGPRPFGVDDVTDPRLTGWALRVDDIDQAIAAARLAGFDPGDALDGQRLTPSGELLRWRLTSKAMGAGLVPFLIDWGQSPHPAASAPQGLGLRRLRLHHSDPPSLRSALRALGADVEVQLGDALALVAELEGPLGVVELR